MGFCRQEYWSGVPLPSLRPTLKELKNRPGKTQENPQVTVLQGKKQQQQTQRFFNTCNNVNNIKSTMSYHPVKKKIPDKQHAGNGLTTRKKSCSTEVEQELPETMELAARTLSSEDIQNDQGCKEKHEHVADRNGRKD